MTVIVFSTAYLPFIGGAETAIKGITDHISETRFIILTSRFNKSIPRAEKFGNVLIYRLGFGNSFDKFFLPFFSFIKFRSISKNLKKPIIFWGMMASYGSLGAWLLKFFHPKVPFLLTIQEGDNEWERNRFWWKLILKKANYVTAISSFLQNKIRKIGYKGKISIIPNGVELDRFRNKELGIKDAKVIISVSRRVYKNGLDILEKAFEIIKKKFPEAELKVLDNTPYEQIPGELQKADIFVRPSRSEGLGTAFLEAMAAGLPIIGTNVGGISDFLEDGETGLFVKVDDPEDLAQKIELLFTDKDLYEKLSQNGKALIEGKYQWSKIAKDMENIFKELT